MQKCDLCIDRLAQGNQPACVGTRPSEALCFGTLEALSRLASAQQLTGSTRPSIEPGTEHNGANSPESLLLGQKITEIPDRVKVANPETYITPAAPPFFLQPGTRDPIVPVQMSVNFAAKLANVLGEDRVQLELLEGAEHGGPPSLPWLAHSWCGPHNTCKE